MDMFMIFKITIFKEEITMRKAKRLLALSVAMISALSFSACGKDDSSSIAGKDLDSEQVEAINSAVDGVDWGNTDLANTEVKWLAHYDINPADGKVEDPGIRLFKEKYNGKITWVQTDWNGRYTKLASLVSSNDSPDMFPASDMDAFPIGAIQGMFQPIDSYIDVNSEYWKDIKPTLDTFSLGDSHYVAVIENSPNLICLYNKTVIDENGFDDPAELYEKGEWTWDVMQEMAIDFTDADADKYAFDGFWWWDAIEQSTGIPLIGMEDGKVVSHLEDASVAEAETLIYDLTKAGVGFPRHLNDWKTRGSNDEGTEGLGQGLTLFIPVGPYEIEDTLANTACCGDVAAGEVMFVPMPSKDGSEPYMPARVEGYCLCSGAKNPEGFAAFMLCKRVANTNGEVKAIGMATLTEEYGWTQEMVDMREECYRLANEKPVFEFYKAVSDEMTTAFNTIVTATSTTNGDAQTWAEVVSANKNGVNYYVEEVNGKIDNATAK